MGFKRKAAKRKAKSDPAEEIEDVEEPDVKDPWCTPDPKWGEDRFEGQAKVWSGFTGENFPILCRPTKRLFKDLEI